MKIFSYLLLCSLPLCLSAQEQAQYSDTIPYRIVEDKMIIQAKINGIDTHFIYDSGGQNVMMLDSAKARNVKAVGGSTIIGDMNRKLSNFQNAQADQFSIGKHYKVKSMRTMVMGNNKSISSLGVSGILSGQAFAHVVVSILPKSQQLVLSYPYRPKNLNRKDAMQIRMNDVQHPFINLQVGDQPLEVLFDTGANAFLMLSTTDFKRLQPQLKLKPTDSAHGVLYVGVSGVGEDHTMHKLSVPEIKLAEKNFKRVGTITTQLGASILGLELLNYGEVTIDYPRAAFYFKPFDTVASILDGPSKDWNVNILPIIDHFEITNVWSSAKDKLKLGERVSNINGTSLEGLALSGPLISKIMHNIPGNTAYLMVGPKGKERKVTISKQ